MNLAELTALPLIEAERRLGLEGLKYSVIYTAPPRGSVGMEKRVVTVKTRGDTLLVYVAEFLPAKK